MSIDIKVSIIVPIYNVENYLVKCIESLINQTYQNLEIILVNDGSPDDSKAIIDDFSKKDDRIKVICQANKGAAHAREAGFKKATGDYLTFCDGDDELTKEAIETLIGFSKKGEIDIVSGTFTYVFDGVKKLNYIFKEKGEFNDGKSYINNMLRNDAFFALHARLFRKSLFENVKAKDVKVGQDAILCLQLFYNAKTIVVEDVSVYNYNQRLTSTSYNKSKKYILETLRFAEVIKEMFYGKNNFLNDSLNIVVLNNFIIALHKGGYIYLEARFEEMGSYFSKYSKYLNYSQKIRYRTYTKSKYLGLMVDRIFGFLKIIIGVFN